MARKTPDTSAPNVPDASAVAAWEAEFAGVEEIEAKETRGIEVGETVCGVYHGSVEFTIPGQGLRVAHDIGEVRYYGNDILDRKLREVSPGMKVLITRITKGGAHRKDSAQFSVKAK